MDGRKFQIEGMDCADEVNALKDALASLAGGKENLTFDLLRSNLVVRADPVAELECRRADNDHLPVDQGAVGLLGAAVCGELGLVVDVRRAVQSEARVDRRHDQREVRHVGRSGRRGCRRPS